MSKRKSGKNKNNTPNFHLITVNTVPAAEENEDKHGSDILLAIREKNRIGRLSFRSN